MNNMNIDEEQGLYSRLHYYLYTHDRSNKNIIGKRTNAPVFRTVSILSEKVHLRKIIWKEKK